MAMRAWLTKDLGWKLSSLLMALVIWVTVHKIREEPVTPSTPGIENIYGNLPIHILSTAGDVRDYQVAPDTVIVTVNGPPGTMAVLQANQIHAIVNLTGVESSHDLHRTVEVSTPVGVTLVNVEPREVEVIVPSSPNEKK